MKNFFDFKDAEITEKAFLQRVIISMLSVLLCLVALCSMTYAWFTAETASSGNTLASGSFDVTVTVSKLEDGVSSASTDTIDPESNTGGKLTYKLQAGTYEISLALTNESTVKGHCAVTIGSGAEQYTDAIIGDNTANVDENTTKTNPLTFMIALTEETNVVLEPRWGIVIDPDIKNGDMYSIPEAQVDSEATQEA